MAQIRIPIKKNISEMGKYEQIARRIGPFIGLASFSESFTQTE